MLSYSLKTIRKAAFIFTVAIGVAVSGYSQSKDEKIIADGQEAKAEFIKTDSHMANLFQSAYGYAIFPNVGKGAVGVGGAAGNGMVYEQGKLIGRASMTQVTVGLQLGGQAYREVIFFESKADLDRFKESKYEFAAQVSAVAAASGVSADAKYKEGVQVYTMEKGGLMY